MLIVPRSIASLALLSILACAACGRARIAQAPEPETARSAIAAASREFSARYERGDAAGQAALYADDAVILPPGRAAIRGRSAIQAYWTLAPGQRVLAHRVTADSVLMDGGAAYDWGTYTVRGERNGEPYAGGGKYLIVWRQDRSGAWRMQLDMWNAGPPVGP